MDDCCEPPAASKWKNLTFSHSVATSWLSLCCQYKALSFWPGYVPSLTARTVARLTLKVLATALTEPPLSRMAWTACIFSGVQRRRPKCGV